jgi:hypothetical protein
VRRRDSDEAAVQARGIMDLLQQLRHGQPGIVIRKPFESIKHLSSDDFFTGAQSASG